MNTTDYKLDAILRCLQFYYSKFTYSNDIYRHSGDESYHVSEFAPINLISALLDFTENETVNMTITELSDLLNHLESEKLIVTEIVSGDRKFKILPSGISLIEKNGYVNKHQRFEKEYKMKWIAIIISIFAFLISAGTFIYTFFLK